MDIVYGWKFPNADENRNGRQQKRKEISFLDCKLVVGYVFIGLSLQTEKLKTQCKTLGYLCIFLDSCFNTPQYVIVVAIFVALEFISIILYVSIVPCIF